MIGKWWHSIKTLPDWGYGLQSLLTPTIGLLSKTLPVVPTLKWDDEVETAYADPKNNLIVVGSRIISTDSSVRLNKLATKEQAVEALLGTIVHEGLHLVFSPDNILGLLNPSLPHNSMTFTVANVLEDVFIESRAGQIDKSYRWMISAMWQYYRPAETMLVILTDEWDGQDPSNIDGILSTMIMWKNRNFNFPMRSDFETELYELCFSVVFVNSLQERKDIIEKVVRFLLSAAKEKSAGSGEGNDGGEAGGSTGEEKEGGEQADVGRGDKESPEGQGEVAKGSEAQSGEQESPTFDVRGKALKVKPLSAKGSKDITKAHRDTLSFGGDSKMPYRIEAAKLTKRGQLVLPDQKKWSAFSKWVTDVGTVRTRRGTPNHYGRLNHPERFADDGKIYSKILTSSPSGRVDQGGAPQTIVLIDLSGSMGEYTTALRETKFSAALKVAGGMGLALARAGHKLSVFGHTTIRAGLETCIVYRFKSMSDSTEHMLEALQSAEATIEKNNNADATALRAVASTFTPDSGAKRIFVISDGMPYCTTYGGSEGIDITKEAVEDLRRRGIEIYSLSIDPTAIKDNDSIYGNTFNFDLTDTKVAESILRKILG